MTTPERSPERKHKFGGGPYLARVVSNVDSKYMGTLHVQLLREVGNTYNRQGQTIPVRYLSPFYGVTNVDSNDKNNNFNGTQKSYGFWAVPPDVGCTVLCVFVEGDIKQGFWIGCVQDEFMNFMVPGLAATELHNDPTSKGKKVVAEWNKKTNDTIQSDTTLIKKPVHPFNAVLGQQGLSTDETRGLTTSSARRDMPSMVFGISTPGPVDRRGGAKTGSVGHYESKVSGAFVSRLGGSTFVMDDGDPTLLRKTPASEGPPEYVNVELSKDGDPTLPHNELVRIRTRTGHQILLHNTEDLIYIGNAKGTTWIELTSNGKLDIYAADSVSIHTKNDLNITADRDINMSAGRKVNILSGDKMHLDSGAAMEIVSGADTLITTSGATNINSGGNHLETAAQIHMNGPAAATAGAGDKPGRVPQAEPWSGHENLNPAGHTPDAKPTDGKLSTTLDTFKKIGK
jgi:hypothetical protein